MQIEDLRKNIDNIDSQIAKLFTERMSVTQEIGKFKKENNLPIFNRAREREILNRIADLCGDDLESYSKVLFSSLFNVSRAYQSQISASSSPLEQEIINACGKTNGNFPSKAVVACQGIEGAYSQMACDKMFSIPSIMYFANFDNVFNAVEKGLCKYGILPIENSSAGSVTEVYDLMKRYNFFVVKSIKLKIDHSLLAKNSVKLDKITEIISHEQAINQCNEFLKTHPNIKVTVCKNTAVAAKMVAESDRCDIAALSSINCAEIYGLNILKSNVQDNDNNYTRFICISKELEIYEGSNKISLMLSITHKPGSLYELISRFYSLDLNLTKLESRPIPEKDFEFMFYFDIDAKACDKKTINLLNDLNNTCEQFTFLGNYSEMF